jgi:DNA ligase (NAD+)
VNRLDHFCGKKGLDIKGLSKATLGKLVDWGWVKEPADLYNLNKRLQVWANIPGFGIKSVNNILNAIDNSKQPKLESFICALGIPHVGKTLSAQLAKEFSSYEEFREAAIEKWDFTQLDGVAYEKASAIWNFDFTEADHVAEYMLGYEITGGPSSNILEGESICITGRLVQHKNRDELVKRITDRGGKVVSGVSKNTTWLINNDVNSTSSKNVTAQRLGIPIITEEEFINQFLGMEI